MENGFGGIICKVVIFFYFYFVMLLNGVYNDLFMYIYIFIYRVVKVFVSFLIMNLWIMYLCN